MLNRNDMDRLRLQKLAAGKYVDAGLSVVPVSYMGKNVDGRALRESGDLSIRRKPTWRRYQKQPPDERKREIWFGSAPRNLGIPGTPSLVILDFDRQEIFQAWKEGYPDVARRTAIQRTSKGYHVLFRTARPISTVFFARFYLSNADLGKAGDVIGVGRFVVAWPSIHPSGHEYRWLEGQAPWESGILEIESGEEVGIEIVKNPVNPLRFLFLVLTNPFGSGEMINKKLTLLLGERTNENIPLFKRGHRSPPQDGGERNISG